jgi:uncharacterized protein with PQ loop repeat
MLPILSPFLTATLEYQHWGVNALTVSFFLSVAITLITAWGLVQQNQTIWRKREVEAVSIFWLVYYAILQLAILIYGASMHSAALVVNGLLALLYIPILLGLWKFKGFSLMENISAGILASAILSMLFLPFKSQFFFVFALGGLLSASMQPIEMWQKKSARGVSIRLISTLLLGNIIWFVYGLAVHDWVLIIVNALAFIIFGTTALLWKRYEGMGVSRAEWVATR